MLSKTVLDRQANVSPITITRVEKGMPCRMETQRKIILALGYKFSDRNKYLSSRGINVCTVSISLSF